MKSYKQLETELKLLKRLYSSSSFAFWSADNFITNQILDKKIKRNKPLNIKKFSFEETPTVLQMHFRKHNIRYLRELIFIRIISLLEIFFVDAIYDVYLRTSVPFENENRSSDFSMGGILSHSSIDDLHNKILDRIGRSLSKKLCEIEKYYKKIFGLNFLDYGTDYHKIEEYYDRRNLFVHALGVSSDGSKIVAKTDSTYRSKYNTTLRELSVDEEYILECLNEVSKFAAFVKDQLLLKIDSSEWSKKNEELQNKHLYLEVKKIDSIVKELEPFYKFKSGAKIFTLKSLTESRDQEGDIVSLKLSGQDEIYSYYYIIKKLEKQGKIIKISRIFITPDSIVI